MKDIRLDKRGFTLVEMAIVLVVVGVLVGMGVGMIGPLTNMSKLRESREIIESNLASVTSWAASNNAIPDTAGFTSVAKTSIDAWGSNLFYLYDNNLYSATPNKDTICGRKSTHLSVVNNAAAPAVTINNVAIIIVSPGEDRATQTTLNGTLGGTAINGILTGSGRATGTITLDPTVSDIVRWVTLDELRSKIGCQGSQLKILNNELPSATVEAQYPNASAGSTLSFVVDGGATAANTLRWCIQAPVASPLPNGLSFSAGVPIRTTPANTCTGLAEASWLNIAAAPNLLTISGKPNAGTQGAYNFTVFVRDNNDTTSTNDNIVSKAFVLTVNP